MTLTVYFVGSDKYEAWEGLPFDSIESATSYAEANPGTLVFSAEAEVKFGTLQQVSNVEL